MAPPRKAPKAKTRAKTAWQPPPPPSKIPLPPVFPHRWACAYGEDEFGLWQAFVVKGVRQMLRWIPPGAFWLGSPKFEPGRTDDDDWAAETRRHVTLTRGFWLADTACTQALWEAVLGENPSRITDDPTNPVVQVSWNDVKREFLPTLNRLVPGLEAELPSEARWEYACRAGTKTPFWFGKQITPEQVNCNGYFTYAKGAKDEYWGRGKPVPVKSLQANGWGLYEMHGNVQEWCEDVMGKYPKEAMVDPRGPQDGATGGARVLRGGSYGNSSVFCRSAHRFANHPGDRSRFIGFRLARGAD
ncbi:MAG TPA: formylglycine-generating enzyme family protein [Burkholderiaceae bacterium]|nr:formylglycine-generating enzyme family protein [Burkholderiaceae bacterium]HMY99630.1 formylglycine-generating enzyme family protein [Burkholderiaceae bacterium]HNB44140.1 formylglycine-generating enzyme family protein [Burkholderiaceae bacterium]HNG78460.1 formylglycine-generating enzyme family protein [Burkholderiaceae bacterium]